PDGDVYLSDWVDNGECHDNDGVHRTSGRIYKIIHGDPEPPMKEKLWEMTNAELLAMHDHENEWFARKARWILLERIAAGDFTREEWQAFFPIHDGVSEIPKSPHIGRYFQTNWAIFQDEFMETNEKNAVAAIDAHDDPASLRIFASQLQRFPPDARWEPAATLLRKSAGSGEVMQLLIYYAIKDRVAEHPEKASELLVAAEDSHPVFTKNLAQNLAENGVFEPLITTLENSGSETITGAVLSGFAAGIRGQKEIPAPDGWQRIFAQSKTEAQMEADAIAINLVFDREGSRKKIGSMLESDDGNQKAMALRILRDLSSLGLDEPILKLIDDPKRGPDAIAILAKSANPKIAETLIAKYGSLAPESKTQAIHTLSGHKKHAAVLLNAIEAGTIPRHAVTAYHARQIQTFKDDDLKKQLAKVWGRTGSTSREKKAEIKKWQDQLLPDVLAKADLKNGHAKYQQLCLACHNLNGEVGTIGPDLTGANRGDLYYLLENIIDPSATLPADFRLTVITKKDGSVVSGNVKSENEYSVTLLTLTDEQVIQLDDIQKRQVQQQSLMPEGLLATLSEEDVRDLIAYLQK
ncbi:MAG: c-type cytochrome, partial [Verrucomicrobiales bacterium]|nr:c-type cytochrome [Verrucomicrobiales bacterium]